MWLGERTEISLHPYQLACLMLIVKVNSQEKKTELIFKLIYLFLIENSWKF